jgi:sulfite reductase (ferredoxin)
MERLLRGYLGTRNDDENLRAWFQRHSESELREYLAGAIVAGVERDQPTGGVPVGVE